VAKGANGTIDIDDFEQMKQQRFAYAAQNLRNDVSPNLGVGKNNTQSLFSESPLLASNRSAENMSRDPNGLYTNANGDVYSAYANVVDPSTPITGGFGFASTDVTNLNYRESSNPFVSASGTNYDALTSGTASDLTGNQKHYLGFPDLQPPKMSDPTENSRPAANSLGIRSPKDNFGTTTSEDRDKLNEVYVDTTATDTEAADLDTRGTFDYDNVDGSTDNLGKYFRRKYTT
jgi:hypothetical protein